MTSYTSPRAYRLNLSRFYENFSYHSKEEYHLLDEKIKAFFSSIVEGFIHEPLHFWFFRTHNYSFTKKHKFSKVLASNAFRYRLIALNKKPVSIKPNAKLSPFISISKPNLSSAMYVRKHILRALFAPGLLKLNRLPQNVFSLKSLHNMYLTYKGRKYVNRKSGLLQKSKKGKVNKYHPKHFLRSKHRLFLTYRNHLRNSNPIILGTCKVLKSTGVIYVQLHYYLDLDQHYTSEMSTILVYRLLASKAYLERVLNLKIEFSLVNYFLFIWKYRLATETYVPKNSSAYFETEHTYKLPTKSKIFESELQAKLASLKFHQRVLSRNGVLSVIKLDELFKRKGLPLRFGLVKALSLSDVSMIKKYQSLYEMYRKGFWPKKNAGKILSWESMKEQKKIKINDKRIDDEDELFMFLKEHINQVLTKVSRWQSNRFFKRTFNIIVPLFFYPFDSQLLANLIAFELQNLRKGHGRYLLFIKMLLEVMFTQRQFRLYRLSTGLKPLLHSIYIKLKGRLIKSRRPSTRTQTITLKIQSAKQRPIRVGLKQLEAIEKTSEANLEENRALYFRFYSNMLSKFIKNLCKTFIYLTVSKTKMDSSKKEFTVSYRNRQVSGNLRFLFDWISKNQREAKVTVNESLDKNLVSDFELLMKVIFAKESKDLQVCLSNLFKAYLKENQMPCTKVLDEMDFSSLFLDAFSNYKQGEVKSYCCLGLSNKEVVNEEKRAMIVESLKKKKLHISNPRNRLDSFQTVSYNRFGIINIEIIVAFNH